MKEEDNIENPRLVPVVKAWAKNSINTTIFRYNSIISFKKFQYTAFYDENGQVTIAKRTLSSTDWEIYTLNDKGMVIDAHNSISLGIDGNGTLHISWNQHTNRLNYRQIDFTDDMKVSDKLSMTKKRERIVTYPEFYTLSNGDLLFFYRSGFSGKGNLMLNLYDHKKNEWTPVGDNIIDGERKRNPYWQIAIDKNDGIHISWCWRETPDVATNHDICYTKSLDYGRTWQKSDDITYDLPITQDNSEIILKIPQNHELINTTSMAMDSQGNPYIISYWREDNSNIPQYYLLFHDGIKWNKKQITNRNTSFSLKGMGTKRVPISRPKIAIDHTDKIYMLFRDVERQNRVSVAICENLIENEWRYQDLTDFSVGAWEPSIDPQLWNKEENLHIFVQNVGQGDMETLEDIQIQMINILEWKPN